MGNTVEFYEREVEFARKNHLSASAVQPLLDVRKRELRELRQGLKELERAWLDRV